MREASDAEIIGGFLDNLRGTYINGVDAGVSDTPPAPPPIEVTPADSIWRGHGQGEQHRYEFGNGYVASVIRGPFTYGGEEGLWELAVMHDDEIVYDTSVTGDVLGWLSDEDLARTLLAVAALPARHA